jgi:2-phosphosulfolactate phosphatase
MHIDVHLAPELANEQGLREKMVVAIDVLRASTTIVTALQNGARGVIPSASIEAAVKLASNLDGGLTLLGGERQGKLIEGFHLGNSPREYTEERVKGKTIVFTTTNGSQAILRGRHAAQVCVCGFVNLSAVCEHAIAGGMDLSIVCAGREGGFSMEDAVCAGRLAAALADRIPATLSDGAKAAMVLHQTLGSSVRELLVSTEHGRYLQSIGLGDDLEICAGLDTVPAVPVYEGNILHLMKTTPPQP